jgi:hypothetical protein
MHATIPSRTSTRPVVMQFVHRPVAQLLKWFNRTGMRLAWCMMCHNMTNPLRKIGQRDDHSSIIQEANVRQPLGRNLVSTYIYRVVLSTSWVSRQRVCNNFSKTASKTHNWSQVDSASHNSATCFRSSCTAGINRWMDCAISAMMEWSQQRFVVMFQHRREIWTIILNWAPFSRFMVPFTCD